MSSEFNAFINDSDNKLIVSASVSISIGCVKVVIIWIIEWKTLWNDIKFKSKFQNKMQPQQ